MSKSPNRNKLDKRLGPGAWIDKDGNLHFSLPELLELFELEDTPENRRIASENIRAMLREQCPDATIVERKSPQD